VLTGLNSILSDAGCDRFLWQMLRERRVKIQLWPFGPSHQFRITTQRRPKHPKKYYEHKGIKRKEAHLLADYSNYFYPEPRARSELIKREI